MKAVLFGAGSIGRGFIAELLTEAGLEVVFIDVNKVLIDAINKQGCYRQVTVGSNYTKEKLINNVRAVDSSEIEKVSDEICDCSLISTSVGADVLQYIAPAIARGLTKRWDNGNHDPVNILICENLNNADKYLEREIISHLSEPHRFIFDKNVGLLETSIGRMIPVVTEEMSKEDPAAVYVEPYRYLPYDTASVKGTMPDIPAAIPYTPFEYFTERKLFVHNMGHFLCALFGQIHEYKFIWEAISDPAIAFYVRSAMSYSALALSKKHGIEYSDLLEHVDDLLYRFSNKALADTIERVLRDIPRKLSPADRLYGAVTLCEEQRVSPGYILLGIAAAHFLFTKEDNEDECVSRLHDAIHNGFAFGEIQEIIQQYQSLNEKMIV